MLDEEFLTPPHYIFLGLIQLDGVGFQTIYNFFKHGKLLIDLVQTESYEEFSGMLGRKVGEQTKSFKQFINDLIVSGERYLNGLNKRGIEFLLQGDYGFPTFPLDMKMPVYWLFVEGKLENISAGKSLTLIGSRDASDTGFYLAQTLLFAISETKEKVVTISGLAAGIDQIVHQISLLLGIPTIAVLGNGLDENYPVNSKQLRDEIIKAGGTIITEYFPYMRPNKESFVQRNRIQAALANVVIPLEWKRKSGTAHTIRFAHEMRKKICYVETPLSRSYFTEHASANYDAQRDYGGDIFVLPNAIANLLENLELNLSKDVVFYAKDVAKLEEVNFSKQPSQLGLDL